MDGKLNRRRLLTVAGLSIAGAVALPVPAYAATWRLHDDTNRRGQGKLYSGSNNNAGCDTAASSDCKGPGRLSAYWGGLYVASELKHQLRTGPYRGCGASFPGNGNADRVRWASTSNYWGQPEYRMVGRIMVHDISARPKPWSGLVFHPVHLNNCNNYYISMWERDYPRRIRFGREVSDAETTIKLETMDAAPALGVWHDYRIDVLPGSHIRMYWNGALVLDAVDSTHKYTAGPVGMRLDYFDATLDETRVYKP